MNNESNDTDLDLLARFIAAMVTNAELRELAAELQG
jgi:hypothetical protein